MADNVTGARAELSLLVDLARWVAVLRHNMAVSLAAMLDGERYREAPR